jgi:hypothetical protein
MKRSPSNLVSPARCLVAHIARLDGVRGGFQLRLNLDDLPPPVRDNPGGVGGGGQDDGDTKGDATSGGVYAGVRGSGG